ncbi:hypothetical protein [Flavobacterium sp.]|uniref:hypothetical protein n=1 Tax=Flavobacterium sp. TaxID=239 RepID=UPI00374FFA0A
MKNIKNIVTALVLLCSFATFGQDINFKKGIVSIDGKECLKYESDSNNVSFQNLKGEDVMILKYLRPDTTQESLYIKVIFVESHQEFTSKSYIFTKKVLIEKLLKSNTLVDCALNEEKLSTFILKYDEKVEDRLNKNTNTTNTVIIKEEPRRSGLNINLGR